MGRMVSVAPNIRKTGSIHARTRAVITAVITTTALSTVPAHVVGTVLSAVVVITAVMTALVLACIDPVLRIFGATDTILPIARDYMVVIGIGFVFNGLAMALSPLLQAEGNPK